jgi:hypothetical protein
MVSGASSPSSPARWLTSVRTVIACLRSAANPGQYDATGASQSSWPRSASMVSAIAARPLLTENTTMRVSRAHGRARATSAWPPHRSTTHRPRW